MTSTLMWTRISSSECLPPTISRVVMSNLTSNYLKTSSEKAMHLLYTLKLILRDAESALIDTVGTEKLQLQRSPQLQLQRSLLLCIKRTRRMISVTILTTSTILRMIMTQSKMELIGNTSSLLRTPNSGIRSPIRLPIVKNHLQLLLL